MDVTNLQGDAQKQMRRRVQMVFQDPYESLNPIMSIRDLVAEPLIVHKLFPEPQERETRVRQALEDAGLNRRMFISTGTPMNSQEGSGRGLS